MYHAGTEIFASKLMDVPFHKMARAISVNAGIEILKPLNLQQISASTLENTMTSCFAVRKDGSCIPPFDLVLSGQRCIAARFTLSTMLQVH